MTPPASVDPVQLREDDSVFKVVQPTRHYPPMMSKFANAYLADLGQMGFVLKVTGSEVVYTSPAHPVHKKGADSAAPANEQFRLTVDLRVVNLHTDPARFPIALPKDFPRQVAGMSHYGKFDCTVAFW